MKALLIGMILATVLMASAQAAPNVSVKFNYDFTNKVLCSTTVTTNCVDHFETLADVTGTLLGTQAVPAGATGVVTGITGQATVPGFGTVTIHEVAVAKNGAGARVQSDPLKSLTTVLLPLDAPSSFTATSP